MPTKLERLSRRFEIAVGNFGRSCIALKANEKAFQAWYAACVIQEFGLAHVYREVHLTKADLAELVGPNPLFARFTKGNELFPDLSVFWEPDVDARHSSTRHPDVKHARQMLQKFAIVSELKVTGSTGVPTPRKLIEQDLAKLALFAAAHGNSRQDEGQLMATYMVLVDNRCDREGRPCPYYTAERTDAVLLEASKHWPDGVPAPVVLLLTPAGNAAETHAYKEFRRVV